MRVLLITGPAGSGKSTVARLLEETAGWVRVAEDEVWWPLFRKNRGAFGSEEHRRKRAAVHVVIFDAVLRAIDDGKNVVVDATVHESPPESFGEYADFFRERGVEWELRVLLPRLEIAVERDATRACWNLGRERVAELHAKFTRAVFDSATFVDNSDESATETAERLLAK